MSKVYNEIDVFYAAVERYDYIFNEFDNICVSFSGGKDSGILLNMAIEASIRHNKKISVLVVDLEAQYKHTINYIERMRQANPNITWHWVCLPLHLRNAVSQIQPHWVCWQPSKKDIWVRDIPENCISDLSYFPFFREGMEFEEFVPAFGEWVSNGQKTACLVGIRSDESINRFRTIKSTSKKTYDNKQWSTKVSENVFNFYPIYDWRTEDVWIANGKYGWDYNKAYDLMFLAGLSIHQMRLCQPYGDDQRKGLYLFKLLEPETWAKVVSRVQGANFGNRYANQSGSVMGNISFTLPDGYTYKSYAKFLLSTMPPYLEEHYRKKIYTFLNWYRHNKQKSGVDSIPDFADAKLESQRKIPSWRRICKVILKNDYWCKGLSFGQTKKEMEKQLDLISKHINDAGTHFAD